MDCLHDGPSLRRKRSCNGAWRVGWFCAACRRFVKVADERGLWLSKKVLAERGIKLSDVPIERYDTLETCGHCKRIEFCEWHHYAPKEMFGDEDAEDWPQGYLCVDCHEYWHDRMGQPIRQRRVGRHV